MDIEQAATRVLRNQKTDADTRATRLICVLVGNVSWKLVRDRKMMFGLHTPKLHPFAGRHQNSKPPIDIPSRSIDHWKGACGAWGTVQCSRAAPVGSQSQPEPVASRCL